MRIIAGTKKGMKLLPPRDYSTRPITDRVKEAIFNVLYKYDLIEDKIIADLFCGVGSFGLEALSRGAKKAVFIDNSWDIIDILRKNITKANFTPQSQIICADVFKTVTAKLKEEYSLIFVDPPYEMSRQTDMSSPLANLLICLAEHLTDEGLVIVRTERKVSLLENYGQLCMVDKRIWGSMAVYFLGKRNDR